MTASLRGIYTAHFIHTVHLTFCSNPKSVPIFFNNTHRHKSHKKVQLGPFVGKKMSFFTKKTYTWVGGGTENNGLFWSKFFPCLPQMYKICLFSKKQFKTNNPARGSSLKTTLPNKWGRHHQPDDQYKEPKIDNPIIYNLEKQLTRSSPSSSMADQTVWWLPQARVVQATFWDTCVTPGRTLSWSSSSSTLSQTSHPQPIKSS